MKERMFNPGIEVIRLIALGSVFFAHFSPWPSSNPLEGAPPWYLGIIAVLSTIGVPMFFAISGYLFSSDRSDSLVSFLRTRRYLVPWLSWATAIYLLFGVSGGIVFSPAAYLKFLVGDPSIYYFLTLLLLYECLAFVLRRANPAPCFPIIAGAGILVSREVLALALRTPGGIVALPRICTFLNPLIFLPAYWLGRALRQRGLEALCPYRPLLAAAALLFSAAKYAETCLTAPRLVWSVYFSPVSIAFGLSAVLALFSYLALPGGSGGGRWALSMGRLVLPVYLCHLLFTGVARQAFLRWGIPLFPWHLAALPLIAAGSFALVWSLERILPSRGRLLLFGRKSQQAIMDPQ